MKTETFFYEFSQNNSGGSFTFDDKLTHRLYIESTDAKKANKKAKELGVYFNGCDKYLDCSCCGDRWYKASETDKLDLPQLIKSYKIDFINIDEYIQYIVNKYGWLEIDARIFYLDGTIKDFYKQKEQ